jgi:hypothetical protein
LVKKKSAIDSALRQAKADVARINKQKQQLLKRANLDIRGYRKELSTLKKQGVVSARINAAQHNPTRYMVSKLKKFKGVASGRELAVPISKMSVHRAREYTEKGIAERVGKFLVVPKTAAKQKADIYKGNIRIRTGLANGEETVIKFPVSLHDLTDFIEWAEDHADILNIERGPSDQFGFQIFGHNAKRGFPNIQSLVNYLMRYDGSTDEYGTSRSNLQGTPLDRMDFVLMRFRPTKGRGDQVHPQLEPYYGKKKYSSKGKRGQGNKKYVEDYRRERNAQRVNKFRMSETKAERERRLEKQREYDRQRANERREERMSKRLLG